MNDTAALIDYGTSAPMTSADRTRHLLRMRHVAPIAHHLLTTYAERIDAR